MAISSAQAISGFNALVSARAISVRDPNSLTQRIPTLAVPDAQVSLRGTAGNPLPLYDASGLLRAVLQAGSSNALPAGTSPGTASSDLQDGLQTVLALNRAESNLASGTGVAAPATSAGTLAALNSVISALPPESGEPGASEVLQNLIAQALGRGSTGLDPTRSAAAALGTAGILNARSSTDLQQALDAVPAEQLELAANALGSSQTSLAGLENGIGLGSRNDASTQAFNRLLAANLEEAVATSDAVRPRRRSTALAGTGDDLLLGGVSLLTGATDTATTDADLAISAEEFALPGGTSPEAFARLALRPIPARSETGQNAGSQTEAGADVIDTAQAPTTRPVSIATAVDRPAATPQTVTANQGATVTATPDTQAPNSGPGITRDPRYAELAAALAMSAAIYRYQTTVSVVPPPGEVDPARIVQPVLAVPQAKSIR